MHGNGLVNLTQELKKLGKKWRDVKKLKWVSAIIAGNEPVVKSKDKKNVDAGEWYPKDIANQILERCSETNEQKGKRQSSKKKSTDKKLDQERDKTDKRKERDKKRDETDKRKARELEPKRKARELEPKRKARELEPKRKAREDPEKRKNRDQERDQTEVRNTSESGQRSEGLRTSRRRRLAAIP